VDDVGWRDVREPQSRDDDVHDARKGGDRHGGLRGDPEVAEPVVYLNHAGSEQLRKSGYQQLRYAGSEWLRFTGTIWRSDANTHTHAHANTHANSHVNGRLHGPKRIPDDPCSFSKRHAEH
jgi:hypothetical protein